MSHFKAKMHQIRFPAFVSLSLWSFDCLFVRLSVRLADFVLDEAWHSRFHTDIAYRCRHFFDLRLLLLLFSSLWRITIFNLQTTVLMLYKVAEKKQN